MDILPATRSVTSWAESLVSLRLSWRAYKQREMAFITLVKETHSWGAFQLAPQKTKIQYELPRKCGTCLEVVLKFQKFQPFPPLLNGKHPGPTRNDRNYHTLQCAHQCTLICWRAASMKLCSSDCGKNKKKTLPVTQKEQKIKAVMCFTTASVQNLEFLEFQQKNTMATPWQILPSNTDLLTLSFHQLSSKSRLFWYNHLENLKSYCNSLLII